ncbi:MAG: hypothetical protein N2B60_09960 [Psychrobacter sp.]
MSNAINSSLKRPSSLDELACYLQSNTSTMGFFVPLASNTQHSFEQHFYKLPVGELRVLEVTLYLPIASNASEIEAARLSIIKSAIIRQKRCLQLDENNNGVTREVLILDIQLVSDSVLNADNNIEKDNALSDMNSIVHSFGAHYFMENLVLDIGEDAQMLQVFSWQDWQSTIAAVQTPSDLWRFLSFHLDNLKQSLIGGIAGFESEQALVSQFMNSTALFSQAITVDNALIKNGLQNEPNLALVAMSLAQKHKDTNAQQTYRQHQQQAATLWSQLSRQMLELATDKSVMDDVQGASQQSIQWLQQLLDESLFSRHELIRTIYKHLEQSPSIREAGYVIHQHSYESLGRHYVIIFYGQGVSTQQSRIAIQPNLQKIAQDVATRLPLAKLHHIIVLGIEFVQKDNDTYIDIDAWIQPVDAMTQKERQLTKQLQRLNQQHKESAKNNPSAGKVESMRMQLSLTIPARKAKL